jgi:uncharacterized protein YidB (DUF937 family)
MGIFDGAVPGGDLAKPLMVVLGALLVGKVMGSFSQPASPVAVPQPSTGGLGGLAGGLGSFLERLKTSGQGDVANSWVGTGANQPIEPNQLNAALGQTTISELARHAGMSEQDLLAQLSRVLPDVVDKLTPGGRVPGQAELAAHFAG